MTAFAFPCVEMSACVLPLEPAIIFGKQLVKKRQRLEEEVQRLMDHIPTFHANDFRPTRLQLAMAEDAQGETTDAR
jgi:hypothetical protein